MQHCKHHQPVKPHWAAAALTYLCAARLCHLPGLKEMLISPCRIQSWIQSPFLPLFSHSVMRFPPFPCSHIFMATPRSWQTLGASWCKALLKPQQMPHTSTGVCKESGLLLLIMVPPFSLKQAASLLKPVSWEDQPSLTMALQIRNMEGAWTVRRIRDEWGI